MARVADSLLALPDPNWLPTCRKLKSQCSSLKLAHLQKYFPTHTTFFIDDESFAQNEILLPLKQFLIKLVSYTCGTSLFDQTRYNSYPHK
jgi:hypothetical protein